MMSESDMADQQPTTNYAFHRFIRFDETTTEMANVTIRAIDGVAR
jgi:hypothetical protein